MVRTLTPTIKHALSFLPALLSERIVENLFLKVNV
jgi:hypothetical protein